MLRKRRATLLLRSRRGTEEIIKCPACLGSVCAGSARAQDRCRERRLRACEGGGPGARPLSATAQRRSAAAAPPIVGATRRDRRPTAPTARTPARRHPTRPLREHLAHRTSAPRTTPPARALPRGVVSVLDSLSRLQQGCFRAYRTWTSLVRWRGISFSRRFGCACVRSWKSMCETACRTTWPCCWSKRSRCVCLSLA